MPRSAPDCAVGVIEADDTESFFDAMDAAAVGLRKRPVRNIAIVTISGLPSGRPPTRPERAGLTLPPLGAATVERLRASAPSFAALGNPIDLTPQCPTDNFVAAIEAIYADPAY